jgi:hypothetical protein
MNGEMVQHLMGGGEAGRATPPAGPTLLAPPTSAKRGSVRGSFPLALVPRSLRKSVASMAQDGVAMMARGERYREPVALAM